MEGLINAATSALGQQGGNNQQQGNQQGGGGGGGFDIGSLSSLIGAATNHAQQNGNQQDASLFSQVASQLQTQHQQGNIQPSQNDPSDQQLQEHHEQVTNGNNQVDQNQIGNAAALGAIKQFLGNSSSGQQGGNMQSQLIGAAMSQAAQLFDQKNGQGLASGDKNAAVQQAGEMVMKLMLKNQVSGMIGGGNSGGLASLASKFL